MAATILSSSALFGGDAPWIQSDWTFSDDRVRGGASQSYLTCTSSTARFHGTLDIKTLGGAGFASQRTTGEERTWDLSSYGGIYLDITQADHKQYTFVLKDEILPKDPGGREQSTISWEYDFVAKDTGERVWIAWEDLKPTYRGKEKKDAEPLKLGNVKRISIMMRSFFGSQEGPFDVTFRSISAGNKPSSNVPESDTSSIQKVNGHPEEQQQGWIARLLGACCVS